MRLHAYSFPVEQKTDTCALVFFVQGLDCRRLLYSILTT